MKLQDQVCTLEQAKKLKELKIKRTSLFYHIDNTQLGYEGVRIRHNLSQKMGFDEPADGGVIRYYSAFTVAELGLILSTFRYEAYGFPMMFTSYCHSNDHTCEVLGTWGCAFRNPSAFNNPDGKFKTEAEARAAMLIWLIENNLITADQVNQKLTQP